MSRQSANHRLAPNCLANDSARSDCARLTATNSDEAKSRSAGATRFWAISPQPISPQLTFVIPSQELSPLFQNCTQFLPLFGLHIHQWGTHGTAIQTGHIHQRLHRRYFITFTTCTHCVNRYNTPVH